MISFKEFCNMNEGAGSLAGLPKEFIKQITSKNNRGGENSKIELYKKNAKQKDLTTAVKTVSEANLGQDNYKYAGVLVKVNDIWSFYAEYEDYSKKFFLLSPEGYKTKRASDEYKTRGLGNKVKAQNRSFDTKELSATDLSDFINFGDDTVDIYLVTADTERINKNASRRDAKQVDNISPEKKAALQQFLTKQAGESFIYVKTILADKAKELTDSLHKDINPETMTFNINSAEAAIAKFSKDTAGILQDYRRVANNMSDIIKDGKVKSWDSKDTYNYDYFKKSIEKLNSYTDSI